MFYAHAPIYGKIMDAAINFAVALAGLDMLQIRVEYFTCRGAKMCNALLAQTGTLGTWMLG